MQYPSEGWPSRYAPGSLIRRGDQDYMERRMRYTQSSQNLGWLRNDLLGLAAEAEMQPPLTHQDIRHGKRSEEIGRELGQSGISLLLEHAVAVEANVEAMLSLRAEANRLAAEINLL